MHRRSVLSTFYIFHPLEFCCKIAEKTEQNWYPQKASKNEAQGVPELTQNGSELIENITKIEKSDKKNMKIEGSIF